MRNIPVQRYIPPTTLRLDLLDPVHPFHSPDKLLDSSLLVVDAETGGSLGLGEGVRGVSQLLQSSPAVGGGSCCSLTGTHLWTLLLVWFCNAALVS